ncbi:MAG: DUF4301 family protein [Bacteroidales bacterium]|nr:DUF4301 family protein [Bacteroidales bacterium]
MSDNPMIQRDPKTIEAQLERFRTGFPWMDIVAPATPQRGIRVLDDAAVAFATEYADRAQVAGKCKFVPASGAASRMFKDIFAGLEQRNAALETLEARIREFAFYTPEVFDGKNIGEQLLGPEGLGYGAKPKGVLKFHRYPDGEVRTALAEHLVEGQEYMRNADGTVNLHITISPEHRPLFEAALAEIQPLYERRYGVRYRIEFSCQDPLTDTIAATPDGKPFLKDDGEPLFRPAGHGALIYNLNAVDAELVSIKNIDNVALERYLPVTARYKKALMGCALQLRDRIFDYLDALEETPDEALCAEIEAFLAQELCIEVPAFEDLGERIDFLWGKLNRPVRVCGMVRNAGDPGGGPFVIREKDGSTSLQILESVQVNPDDPAALAAMKSATHFNPVDLVCCLRDYRGNKFDLPAYVDPDTGFISSKSYQGRELKALELPGLWNGSMSDWNTQFVEVPAETFNPVKVVLDLLKPAHNPLAK